jgi:hypothetical protein
MPSEFPDVWGYKQSGLVAFSSFMFSVLQSICTAILAINGVRFALGMGTLLLNVGIGSVMFRFHQLEALRYLFMFAAILGSTANLVVVAQVRRLRKRPAAQWRIRPQQATARRKESLQLSLAVLTLCLVVVEEALHIHLFHAL